MFIDYLIEFFVFVFGLCIGSFLNCVIYRLEEGKSLKGRSFCPNCKHTLYWKDLFPVFSFLFLKGKCRYCKKSISWQYPVVELVTGLVFLLFYNLKFVNVPGLVFLLYIASVLIIIFVYDLKHYIIPDKVLFPAIIIAFAYNFVNSYFILHNSLFTNSLLAAAIAGGFFLLVFLISKGRAMGLGDAKLAVLMGFLLGVENVLVALFLAFFFGAIIGVILMVFPFGSGRQKKSLKSEIPFGPFLIAGAFLALFWGPQIVDLYLRLIS